MPIRAFGIFAGVIVPINYMLVVLFFPPAVIWYERHIVDKGRCMCWAKMGSCCKKNNANKVQQEGGSDSEAKEEKVFNSLQLGFVERIFD